jgi:putative heme iron utilization protein
MDEFSRKKLVELLTTRTIASLGTIRDLHPYVSMVLFASADDFSAFYIHASKLAFHTQDFLKNHNVSLLVMEAESANPDPQQLARISIRGVISAIEPEDTDFGHARSLYLTKFPQSEPLFNFADFSLYRIVPVSSRYVAGFAKAFNLSPDGLKGALVEG